MSDYLGEWSSVLNRGNCDLWPMYADDDDAALGHAELSGYRQFPRHGGGKLTFVELLETECNHNFRAALVVWRRAEVQPVEIEVSHEADEGPVGPTDETPDERFRRLLGDRYIPASTEELSHKNHRRRQGARTKRMN